MTREYRRLSPDDMLIIDTASQQLLGVRGSFTGGKDALFFDPANVAITGGAIGLKVAGAAKTLRKLAACSAAADRGNALTNPPMLAIPAWAASTVYMAGAVVNNNASQYICGAGGTSAASTGPAGTTTRPITDGTVTWFFYGLPRNVVAFDAPTVTYAAVPAGLTVRVAAVAQAASFFYSGGVPTALGNGYVFPAAYTVSGGNVTSSYTGSGPSATFMTDAQKIAIGGLSSLYADVAFKIEIDDVPLSDSIAAPAAFMNPGAIILDWTGKARKTRKVRVWLQPNISFDGVFISPQDKLFRPNSPNRFRLMVQGDSLTQGGLGTPYQPDQSWPHQVGKLLGCDDVWNIAIGGTGFISDNGGTKATFGNAIRLLDVTNNSPDLLIIAGNHNDINFSNTAQQAAIISYLQAIRAALPNVIILMFGPNPEALSANALMIAAEANCLAAVNTFADAHCLFVPVITDQSGSWMTGAGKVTALTGVGNSDIYTSSDGVHPTQLGVDYLAARYAQAIRAALNI